MNSESRHHCIYYRTFPPLVRKKCFLCVWTEETVGRHRKETDTLTSRADVVPIEWFFRVGSWKDWLWSGTDSSPYVILDEDNGVWSSWPRILWLLGSNLPPHPWFQNNSCHYMHCFSQPLIQTYLTQRLLSYMGDIQSSECRMSELAYRVTQNSRGLKLASWLLVAQMEFWN